MTVADAKLTKPVGELAEKGAVRWLCPRAAALPLPLGSAAGHRLSSRLNRSVLVIVYQTEGAFLWQNTST